MKKSSRSPVRDAPLRVPGQSLEEQKRKLWNDYLEAPVFIAGALVAMALIEWLRSLSEMPPAPIIFTFAAAVSVLVVIYRLVKVRPRISNLKQGIQGERIVGQFLDRLRERGYQVFHDIQGEGFNVDHVLIGPPGIFTVETKTWSKPGHGSPCIQFDGEQLSIKGRSPTRGPVIQARAQAAWLRQLVNDGTGKNLRVFPVVAFPGWFIEQPSHALGEQWVLEPKALVKFLENEPTRLSTPDIKMVAYFLSRFIRSVERERIQKT